MRRLRWWFLRTVVARFRGAVAAGQSGAEPFLKVGGGGYGEQSDSKRERVKVQPSPPPLPSPQVRLTSACLSSLAHRPPKAAMATTMKNSDTLRMWLISRVSL